MQENTFKVRAEFSEARNSKPQKHLVPSVYRTRLKRALDVVLALSLLVAAAPVVLALWMQVRRDGGPGFYAQERVGKDGKTFLCWKLRTMHVDADAMLQKICAENPERAAEWERNQKLKNDPRVTKVGAFLRATSLDELPQIWNVLRGDMSFVGPRPMMVSQTELYRSGGGNGYYSLRPGITGPWQLDGRGNSSFLDRVRYDNRYLAEVSFLTDLSYILRTAGVVVRRTGE